MFIHMSTILSCLVLSTLQGLFTAVHIRSGESGLWRHSPAFVAGSVPHVEEEPNDIRVVIFGPSNPKALGGAQVVSSKEGNKLKFNCDRDYFLIFALGKTGTSTLDSSVRATTCMGKHDRLSHDYRSLTDIEKFLEGIPRESTLWIAHTVRNPFERSLSAVFQVRGDRLKDVHEARKSYEAYIPRVLGVENSFYNGLKHTIGMSIKNLAQLFDFDRNLTLIHQRHDRLKMNVYIMLLRLEDVDDWQNSIGAYFPGFSLVSSRIASEKPYGKLYERFRSNFSYRQDQVDTLFQSPTMRFYRNCDIKRIIARTGWFDKVNLHP